ncbi:hypothetical protein A3Q56_07684, partial [Intoshia linei]
MCMISIFVCAIIKLCIFVKSYQISVDNVWISQFENVSIKSSFISIDVNLDGYLDVVIRSATEMDKRFIPQHVCEKLYQREKFKLLMICVISYEFIKIFYLIRKAYRHREIGTVERLNRIYREKLRTRSQEDFDNWDEDLKKKIEFHNRNYVDRMKHHYDKRVQKSKSYHTDNYISNKPIKSKEQKLYKPRSDQNRVRKPPPHLSNSDTTINQWIQYIKYYTLVINCETWDDNNMYCATCKNNHPLIIEENGKANCP